MESGRILTHPAVARRRFGELLACSEPDLDLTEASLVIALEEYPSLDVRSYLEQIDEWSEAIRDRIEGSQAIERVVEEMNRLLFEEEGFHGEAGDYYDPRYAFLNEVLDRHAGLPLALSIVYLELSRRLGIPSAGVSLPGRFLVKIAGPWGEILVDPFEGGRVLSTVECQRILDQVFGGGVRLHEHHLRSISRREILARLLAHLKTVYMTRGDLIGALASVERLLMIDGRDPDEIRARGVLGMQLHRYREAISDFERYLEVAPPWAEDTAIVREQIDWLRAWLDQN